MIKRFLVFAVSVFFVIAVLRYFFIDDLKTSSYSLLSTLTEIFSADSHALWDFSFLTIPPIAGDWLVFDFLRFFLNSIISLLNGIVSFFGAIAYCFQVIFLFLSYTVGII